MPGLGVGRVTYFWRFYEVVFVLLYKKSKAEGLSEEEKKNEIAKLEENRQEDNMGLGDFGLDDDKGFTGPSGQEETRDQETIG